MKPAVAVYNEDVTDMHRQIYDYATTLTFWRALEEKYRERKRKWLAAKAHPKVTPRPLRRECTILKTTIPLEIDVKESEASYSTLTEEYIDTSAVNDQEFSDVDSDLFTDPGDVRHSTLDEEAWARICAEIRALHRKAETKLERKRRLYLWRLALTTVFVIFILLGGAYLLWKALLTAPSDTPKQECTIRCYGGAETVVSEIIETVFPEYYEEGKPSKSDDDDVTKSSASRTWLLHNQPAIEQPHDKINKMTLRPAKIQISLGFRQVLSESSLSTQ